MSLFKAMMWGAIFIFALRLEARADDTPVASPNEQSVPDSSMKQAEPTAGALENQVAPKKKNTTPAISASRRQMRRRSWWTSGARSVVESLWIRSCCRPGEASMSDWMRCFPAPSIILVPWI